METVETRYELNDNYTCFTTPAPPVAPGSNDTTAAVAGSDDGARLRSLAFLRGAADAMDRMFAEMGKTGSERSRMLEQHE